MKSILIMLTVTFFGIGGCDAEGWEPDEDHDDLLDARAADCQKSVVTGCLQGQVPAAPNITVEGREFFDANDLAARFKELLPPLKDRNGVVPTEGHMQLKWLTRIDNDSFADGFHVYLKGPSAQDQSVMRNGSFAIHRLQPGLYDARVQKEFKFYLIGNSQSEESADPNTEISESNLKSEAIPNLNDVRVAYCATFYAEESFEIRRGYRTGSVIFDRFEVELSECGINSDEIKVQLN